MSISAATLINNISAPRKDGVLDSFFSLNNAQDSLYFRGDINALYYFPVRPSADSGRYWDSVEINPAHIFLGVGDEDAPPTGGTTDLNYNGDDTNLTGISATISATDLQAAINSNTSVIGESDTVVVTKLADGVYQIAWQNDGARELIQGDPTNLIPQSVVVASWETEGGAGTKAVQILQFIQRPFIYVDSWTPTPDVAATVEELREGTVSEKAMFQIKISPYPFAGTFSVDGSAPIAYNATQEEMLAALGDDWGACIKTGDGQYTIERAEAGVYTLESEDVDVSGLSVYKGFIGTLNFNAATLFKRFLTEGDSFTTNLQIRYQDGTYRDTLLFIPVTLRKDILSGSLSPSNWNALYYTKGETDASFVALSGSYNNPSWITALAWSKITGAEDLAAIEALTGTGMLSRTGTNTWTLRTITAGSGIGVTNGTGASGNPTVAVDSTVVRTTGDQSVAGKKALHEPFFVMQELAVNSVADDWVQLGYLNHPHGLGSVRLGVHVTSGGERAGYIVDIATPGYGTVPSAVVNYSSLSSLPEIKAVRFRRQDSNPRLYVDVQLARTVNPNTVRAYVIAPVLPTLFYEGSWVWQMAHNPDTTGTTTLQTLTLPAQTRGTVTSAGLTVTGAATIGGTLGVTGNTTLGGTLSVTGAATLNGQPSYASAASNTALTKSMGDAGYLLASRQVVKRKASDTIRSETTTPEPDPDLIVPVGANETWEVTLHLSAFADVEGYRGQLAAPAGSAIRGTTVWYNGLDDSTGISSHFVELITAFDGTITVTAVVRTGGTAGNLTWDWAQSSSDSSPTTMQANSTMTARRLE